MEELELLKSELTWITLYFDRQIEIWKGRLDICGEELAHYARKQIKTWSLLKQHANNASALAGSGSDGQ